MRSGTYDPSAPVSILETRIEVDGVRTPYVSLSWDREIASGFPSAIPAGSGIQAWTGTVEWLPPALVEDRLAGPWSREGAWPPKPGQRVEIKDQLADRSIRSFTGRIDKTTGGLNGAWSSTIVDDTDQLEARMWATPDLRRQPSIIRDTDQRGYHPPPQPLEPWATVYRALDAAGRGITPWGGWPILARAHFQGTAVPNENGFGEYFGVGPYTKFPVANGLEYIEGSSALIKARQQAVVSPVCVRAVIPQGMTAICTITLTWRSGKKARIRMGRDVCEVSVDGTVVGEVRRTPQPDDPLWQTVQVRLAGSQATFAYGQQGQNFSLSSSPVGNSASDRVDAVAVVNASAVQVDGTTANNWTWPHPPVGFQMEKSSLVTSMDGSRTIINESTRAIMEQISEATCTAMWLDEDGIFQWRPSEKLAAKDPVRTYDTAVTIDDLSWSEDALSTRERVVAAYQEVAVTASYKQIVTLYEPQSGQEIDPDDEPVEMIVGPSSDEEWIYPDLDIARIREENTEYQHGLGSFWDVAYTEDNGSTSVSLWTPAPTVAVEQIALDRWKVTATVAKSEKTGRFHLQSANAWTAQPGSPYYVPLALRDKPMPIIRGQALATFTDASVWGATTGPAGAGELSHDMGVWGRKADAQRVADWLSQQLASPPLVLSGVEVATDPLLQVGDVVTLRSKNLLGAEFRVLVTGIHRSVSRTDEVMALDCRVISVTLIPRDPAPPAVNPIEVLPDEQERITATVSGGIVTIYGPATSGGGVISLPAHMVETSGGVISIEEGQQ